MMLDAIALLAAEMPDPGSPSFMTLGTALGAFGGALVGRCRRLSREQWTHMTADGAFVGGGCGLTCWLIAVAIDRL